MEGALGGKGKMGDMLQKMMMAGGKGEQSAQIPSDPLMMAMMPPRFDNIMGSLEQAGRLAEFLDQVDHACKLGDSQEESLDQLAGDEAKITAAIEELLHRVKGGELFQKPTEFGKPAVMYSHKDHHGEESARAKLTEELTDAASKEDNAKIVQDAGAIAEAKIKKTLAEGLARKPADTHKSPKMEHHPKEHHTEDQHTEDVHVPVSKLRDASMAQLDATLTGALKLYKKRHKQHKQLNIKEHKELSQQLRLITAHLMKKVTHQAAHKVTHQTTHNIAKQSPEKPATVTATKETSPAAQKAVAPTEQSKAPVPQVQVPMPVAPFKNLQVGTSQPVKSFIWHVLGKDQSAQTTAPSLASLLRKGVKLFNGGRVIFDTMVHGHGK